MAKRSSVTLAQAQATALLCYLRRRGGLVLDALDWRELRHLGLDRTDGARAVDYLLAVGAAR